MENFNQPKKKKGCLTKLAIGLGVFILIVIIAGIFDDNNKNGEQVTQEQNTSEDLAKQDSEMKQIGLGDVLKTSYFEIKANSAQVHPWVNTGNQFADLPAEDGVLFLIINATFKIIDSESRMLFDGSVWINYQGKDYEFDKSETIMAPGWGLMMDQINPLVSKTTNLVYKIPSEMRGKAFWQPGRSNEDERIYLGELNY